MSERPKEHTWEITLLDRLAVKVYLLVEDEQKLNFKYTRIYQRACSDFENFIYYVNSSKIIVHFLDLYFMSAL